MADQRGYIQAEPESLDFVEPGGQVHLRAAAVAGNHRGDAVEQKIVAPWIPFDAAFDVSVNVDKARRHDALSSVDGAGCRSIANPAHRPDAPVLHTDIRAEPWVAATVDDARVADQNIVVRRRGDERRHPEQHGAHSPFGLPESRFSHPDRPTILQTAR